MQNTIQACSYKPALPQVDLILAAMYVPFGNRSRTGHLLVNVGKIGFGMSGVHSNYLAPIEPLLGSYRKYGKNIANNPIWGLQVHFYQQLETQEMPKAPSAYCDSRGTNIFYLSLSEQSGSLHFLDFQD